MGLKIEHLAPYLPYNVEMIFEKSGRTLILNGLSENEYGNLIFHDITGEKFLQKHWNFKPLLRPLSQLTEEIEHNGERVNVLKELGLFQESVSCGKIVDYRTGEQIKTEHLEYARVEILFKYHFDVFNLLEQGLALPIQPVTK